MFPESQPAVNGRHGPAAGHGPLKKFLAEVLSQAPRGGLGPRLAKGKRFFFCRNRPRKERAKIR